MVKRGCVGFRVYGLGRQTPKDACYYSNKREPLTLCSDKVCLLCFPGLCCRQEDELLELLTVSGIAALSQCLTLDMFVGRR